jgi:hypothetical protein
MKEETFEQAVAPLMEWLAKNSNPHATVIVTSQDAELLHGVECFNTES